MEGRNQIDVQLFAHAKQPFLVSIHQSLYRRAKFERVTRAACSEHFGNITVSAMLSRSQHAPMWLPRAAEANLRCGGDTGGATLPEPRSLKHNCLAVSAVARPPP